MDIVFIEDLRIETVIGIYDWERKIKQTIAIDLQMGTDISEAAKSDDVKYALDYKSVSKRLIDYVADTQFQLIETLAEEVAQLVLKEFDVQWLRLKLSKPGALRGAKNVGLIIERENF